MSNVKVKTGGGSWVEYDSPKPPPVRDRYDFWSDPPPDLSERCKWWLRQIANGWQPNRRWRAECYDCSAELYGIYIWEYSNVISPALGHYPIKTCVPNDPDASVTVDDEFTIAIKKYFRELFDFELNKVIIYGETH